MSDKDSGGKSYKETLNLPNTDFSMRGDLVNREPVWLEKGEADNLYFKITERRKAEGAEKVILH